jgi:hypothetical protein
VYFAEADVTLRGLVHYMSRLGFQSYLLGKQGGLRIDGPHWDSDDLEFCRDPEVLGFGLANQQQTLPCDADVMFVPGPQATPDQQREKHRWKQQFDLDMLSIGFDIGVAAPSELTDYRAAIHTLLLHKGCPKEAMQRASLTITLSLQQWMRSLGWDFAALDKGFKALPSFWPPANRSTHEVQQVIIREDNVVILPSSW